MESNKDQELIQKYLDREATPQEVAEVEQRLQHEGEFSKLYRELKVLPAGIRYHALNDKLQQLRALEKALPPIEEDAKVRVLQTWWKPLAAAAAILVIAASVLWFTTGNESAADLYARNFEPYPNVFEPTQRGTEGVRDNRATAFALYEQGKYEAAASLFQDLLKVKEEPEILLLLGNCNMVLDRDEVAKNNFLTLISDFDVLDEQAKWFLSLCYLKSGETVKARMIWEELGDPRVTYSEKAKRLLKEIK